MISRCLSFCSFVSDYSLQPPSPEEDLEENIEDIKEDDHEFVPKEKPVRKLKRLKKFRKSQLLKQKNRKKLAEEAATIIDRYDVYLST